MVGSRAMTPSRYYFQKYSHVRILSPCPRNQQLSGETINAHSQAQSGSIVDTIQHLWNNKTEIGLAATTVDWWSKTVQTFKAWWQYLKDQLSSMYTSAVDKATRIRDAIAVFIRSLVKGAKDSWVSFKAFFVKVFSYLGVKHDAEIKAVDDEINATETPEMLVPEIAQPILQAEKSQTTQAQSGEEPSVATESGDSETNQEESYVSQAWKGICDLCTSLVAYLTSWFEDFRKDLPSIGDIFTNVKKSMDFWFSCKRLSIDNYLKRAVNWVWSWFSDEPFFEDAAIVYEIKKSYKEINNLTEAVAQMAQPPTVLVKEISLRVKKFTKLITDANVIVSPQIASHNQLLLKTINTNTDIIMRSASQNAGRRRPVSIVIFGEPGLGKTLTTDTIRDTTMKIVSSMIAKAKFANETTARAAEAIVNMHKTQMSTVTYTCANEKIDFGDGYNNQLFAVFEELYSSISKETNTQWACAFMAAIDSATYMLDMAFDKGKVYFDSPFVLATGNAQGHTIPFVQQDAYHRRIDLDLRATAKHTAGSPKDSNDVLSRIRFKFSSDAKRIHGLPIAPNKAKIYIGGLGKTMDDEFSFDEIMALIATIYFDRYLADYGQSAFVQPMDLTKTEDIIAQIQSQGLMIQEVDPKSLFHPLATNTDLLATLVSETQAQSGYVPNLPPQRTRANQVKGEIYQKVSGCFDSHKSLYHPPNQGKLGFCLKDLTHVYYNNYSDFTLLTDYLLSIPGVKGMMMKYSEHKPLYVTIYDIRRAHNAFHDQLKKAKKSREYCMRLLIEFLGYLRVFYEGTQRLNLNDEAKAQREHLSDVFCASYEFLPIHVKAYYAKRLHFSVTGNIYKVHDQRKAEVASREHRVRESQHVARPVTNTKRGHAGKFAAARAAKHDYYSQAQSGEHKPFAQYNKDLVANFTVTTTYAELYKAYFFERMTYSWTKVKTFYHDIKPHHGHAKEMATSLKTMTCQLLKNYQTQVYPKEMLEMLDIISKMMTDETNNIMVLEAFKTYANKLTMMSWLAFINAWHCDVVMAKDVNKYDVVSALQHTHLLQQYFEQRYTQTSTIDMSDIPHGFYPDDTLLKSVVTVYQVILMDLGVPEYVYENVYNLDSGFKSLFTFVDLTSSMWSAHLDTITQKYDKPWTLWECFALGFVLTLVTSILTAIISYVITWFWLRYNPKHAEEQAFNSVVNILSCLKSVDRVGVANNVVTRLQEKYGHEQQAAYYGTGKSNPHLNVVKTAAANKAGIEKAFSTQAQNGQDEYGLFSKEIAQNMYTIKIGPNVMGQMLCVGGNIFVCNRHVYQSAIQTQSRVIPNENPHGSADVSMLLKNFKVLATKLNRDLTILQAPSACQRKHIWKKFVSKSELHSYDTSGKTKSVLALNPLTQQVHNYPVGPIHFYSDEFEHNACDKESFSLVTSMRLGYEWAQNAKGVCGSPLISQLNRGQPRVFGIHISGNLRHASSAAVPVFRSDFEGYFTSTTPEGASQAQAGNVFTFADIDPIMPEAYTKVGDKFVTKVHTSATNATVLKPTPLQEHKFRGGSPKIPAILDQEALDNAQRKTQQSLANVKPTETVIDYCYLHEDSLLDGYVRHTTSTPMPCKMLTPHQAIWGDPELGIESYDFSTADGIRLKLLGIRKEELRDPDSASSLILLELLDKYIDHFRTTHEYTYQINSDCLKDELRPLDRVQQKKTRKFNVTDFVDNVLAKMALGHLYVHMARKFQSTVNMCGVNPGSSVWGEIYRRFRKRDKILATDISGMDEIMFNYHIMIIRALIRKHYKDTFECEFAQAMVTSSLVAIRFNLGMGVINGQGNTSGNQFTTWFNSMTIHICYQIVAHYIALNNDIDPKAFTKSVRLCVYSDDSLSASSRPEWSPVAVADAFKNLLGVTITDANKDAITEQSVTNRDEMVFLSRRFRKVHGVVHCPLEYDSLISQLYFVRVPKNTPDRAAFVVSQLNINIDNVSRELIEYEPAVAQEITESFNEFIMFHNLHNEGVNFVEYVSSEAFERKVLNFF